MTKKAGEMYQKQKPAASSIEKWSAAKRQFTHKSKGELVVKMTILGTLVTEIIDHEAAHLIAENQKKLT